MLDAKTILKDIPEEGSSLVTSEGSKLSLSIVAACELPIKNRDRTPRAKADINATRLFVICTPIA